MINLNLKEIYLRQLKFRRSNLSMIVSKKKWTLSHTFMEVSRLRIK